MRRTAGLAAVATLLMAAAPPPAVQHVTASVYANPLEVSLDLRPARVDAGSLTRAIATITNHADGRLTEVSALLLIDPSDATLRPQAEQSIGSLDAGRSTQVSWDVCVAVQPTEPVGYLMLAQVSASDGDQRIDLESATRTLVVTVPRHSRSCRGDGRGTRP